MAKDFSNNAAFEMLNNTPASEPAAKASEGKKKTAPKKEAKAFEPTKKETKKRISVMLKPTLYERAKEKAAKYDLSFGEFISQLLEQNC